VTKTLYLETATEAKAPGFEAEDKTEAADPKTEAEAAIRQYKRRAKVAGTLIACKTMDTK